VWLAVLVTNGARSIMAALAAGLLFYLMPGLFQTFLPSELAEVPILLFGIGAILLAKNPDGVIAMNRRKIAELSERWRKPQDTGPGPEPASPPDESREPVATVREERPLTTGGRA
jgi:branched-chain amino acid transport system permease protein